MKILITGGCGFVGSNLVKAFLSLCCEVMCIDNFMQLLFDRLPLDNNLLADINGSLTSWPNFNLSHLTNEVVEQKFMIG